MTKDDILTVVIEEYGISKDSLMSRCREQPLAEARQMAMYLFRHELSFSKSEIARFFARLHPTVEHGIKRIDELMAVDRSVKRRYDRIINELRKEA